jgi:hypothetical protein
MNGWLGLVGHHPRGVCYRKEFAAASFTPYLIEVRLYPIQLIE